MNVLLVYLEEYDKSNIFEKLIGLEEWAGGAQGASAGRGSWVVGRGIYSFSLLLSFLDCCHNF